MIHKKPCLKYKVNDKFVRGKWEVIIDLIKSGEIYYRLFNGKKIIDIKRMDRKIFNGAVKNFYSDDLKKGAKK